MRTGRRTADWRTDANAERPEGERRDADRRARDRRSPQRCIDTLFAVTLVGQVSRPEEAYPARAFSYFSAPRATLAQVLDDRA